MMNCCASCRRPFESPEEILSSVPRLSDDPRKKFSLSSVCSESSGYSSGSTPSSSSPLSPPPPPVALIRNAPLVSRDGNFTLQKRRLAKAPIGQLFCDQSSSSVIAPLSNPTTIDNVRTMEDFGSHNDSSESSAALTKREIEVMASDIQFLIDRLKICFRTISRQPEEKKQPLSDPIIPVKRKRTPPRPPPLIQSQKLADKGREVNEEVEEDESKISQLIDEIEAIRSLRRVTRRDDEKISRSRNRHRHPRSPGPPNSHRETTPKPRMARSMSRSQRGEKESSHTYEQIDADDAASSASATSLSGSGIVAPPAIPPRRPLIPPIAVFPPNRTFHPRSSYRLASNNPAAAAFSSTLTMPRKKKKLLSSPILV